MKDFQFFVTDDRSSVRDVMFVQAKDANAARSIAEHLLEQKHRLSVEVWVGNDRLFTVGLSDQPSSPLPPSPPST